MREIEKIQQAVQRVQQAKYEVSSGRRLIEEKQKKIEHIKQSAAHTMSCPACAADLLETGGKLVEFDENSAEEQRASRVGLIESEIYNIEDKLAKLLPMVDKEALFVKKLDEAKTKRIQARHEYDMAVQKKSHLVHQMNAYKQALEINRELKREDDKLKERIDKAVEIINDFIEFDSNFIDEYDDFLYAIMEYLNGRH